MSNNTLCRTCAGTEWVCENHRDRPWKGLTDHADACECGAGAPCGSCNLRMASAGFVEPYRELVSDAIQQLESAERETNWGDPLFGPTPSEDIRQRLTALATSRSHHEGASS